MPHIIINTRTLCMFLLAALTFNSYAASGFHGALLSDMAKAMKMTQKIEALDEGTHVAALSYSGRPITVIVKNDRVAHIGYSIFTAEHRDYTYSPFFDAIERYALLEKLPIQRQKTVERELFEEGIHIDAGSLSILPGLYNAADVEFSLSNDNGKKYHAVWTRKGSPVCEITLPFTYELLHGTTMEENESYLISDLLECNAKGSDESIFTLPSVSREQLITFFPYSYYICPGEAYYFDNLNANRYYTKADSINFAPIYDEKYPLESLANLTTSLEVPNNMTLEVKIIQYNYRSATVALPLSAFVKYCIDNGCTPFFGVLEHNDDSIVCQLLMRNIDEGYCHLLKIKAGTETPGANEGKLTARMSPYIPISKISALFADPTEAQQVKQSQARKIRFKHK